MIRYQLRCGNAHEFEGWFRSSDAFDQQSASGLVSCPECASIDVDRALMAPSVVAGSRFRAMTAGSDTAETAAAGSTGEVVPTGNRRQAGPGMPSAGGGLPDALRAVLSRMRETVERECDYVGSGFADEARRMHRGEIERRAIYGEATDREREALADDGVEVARIPWLRKADS